jgi:hypothetical protein
VHGAGIIRRKAVRPREQATAAPQNRRGARPQPARFESVKRRATLALGDAQAAAERVVGDIARGSRGRSTYAEREASPGVNVGTPTPAKATRAPIS